MRYIDLGPSGIRVSRICLGSATFGVAPTARDADAVVGAALEAGVTFLHTANVYGNAPVFDRPGHPVAAECESAEEILGRALVGRRDEVVLTSKAGERRWDPDAGLSRRYLQEQVEQSLRRLRTDRLDIHYAHFPDPGTSREETFAAYDELIAQGKIRCAALSNHSAGQLTEALGIAEHRGLTSAPVAAQVMYSLMDRSVETELAPACEASGLSVVPYAPLHGGLLASLAVLEREVSGGQRYGGSGFVASEITVARELDRLARDWGLGMQQVALAWLLSRPAVASVIVGAETPEEVRANRAAADVVLAPEQLTAVSALTDHLVP